MPELDRVKRAVILIILLRPYWSERTHARQEIR